MFKMLHFPINQIEIWITHCLLFTERNVSVPYISTEIGLAEMDKVKQIEATKKSNKLTEKCNLLFFFFEMISNNSKCWYDLILEFIISTVNKIWVFGMTNKCVLDSSSICSKQVQINFTLK